MLRIRLPIWNSASPWPRRVVRIGLVWAAVLCLLMATSDPTPENRTKAISIVLSGVYTLLLYRTRRRWLPRWSHRPLRSAMILGSLNAAVIETLFLVVQTILGAHGVAAHSNLIVDLLLTMPWYTGMVIIFVRVQHARRFSPWIVLLLGGVYEIGADGLIGGSFAGTLFTPAALLLFPLVILWLFVPVYSSMVLPPAWVIDQVPPPVPALFPLPQPEKKASRPRRALNAYRRHLNPRPSGPAWRDALRPLLWLIPFVLYLLVFLVVAVALSSVIG